MRLRVRHPAGMVTLSDPTPEQTVLDLKQNISQVLSLEPTQTIEISGGYPPKPITNDALSLSTAGLKDGDTLNIKIVDKPQQELSDSIVETSNGFLTLRVMEDDNSCLFRSIVIAKEIQADPYTYSDVTLGQPRDKYIEWIQKPNAWGGAIELAIFSSHFAIEIDSIDVQTGRIDKFGEGKYEERVLIVYSGIHYDALALSPAPNSPMDFDQTRFSVQDNDILEASKLLADSLRKKHKYTDVANFTLKCEQCKTGLKGEKDAQEHATTTGHTRFTEYQ